jgi:DHA2 family multidrug resistance protein
VIAFDTAFTAIALLLVMAVPVLIAVKIALSRYAKVRKEGSIKSVRSTQKISNEACHAELRVAA